MPTDELDCPYCPKTASRDGSTEPPERRLAQHILQSQDHDVNTYAEALKRVESYNSDSEGAEEGSEGVEPPEADGTVENDGDEPPHHTSPAVHFETSETTNASNCPECGASMERIGGGMTVKGDHDGETVGVETERGDKFCEGCSLIETVDGEVVTNVR